MMVRNLKHNGTGGLDLRDYLFLGCAAIAIYGMYRIFGTGAACVVAGIGGMYMIFASTPEPEEPQPPAAAEAGRPPR